MHMLGKHSVTEFYPLDTARVILMAHVGPFAQDLVLATG